MTATQARPGTGPRETRKETGIERILDAFERVVLRDGIHNAGANAVTKEAGVAKPQLYKYFGGLPGLVREWGRRRRFWPTHEELIAGDESLYVDGDPKEQIKRRLVRLGNILRERPLVLEVLIDELNAAESPLAEAFREIRARRGDADRNSFQADHPYLQRENFRLVHVMFAAIVYFALRSRRNPNLQGIRLDTDEGWNDTMKMVEEIIDDSILASKFRGLMADHGKET